MRCFAIVWLELAADELSELTGGGGGGGIVDGGGECPARNSSSNITASCLPITLKALK